MYPEQHVLLQTVPAAEIKAELAEKAVAAPAAHCAERKLAREAAKSLKQPHKTPAQIVDDLLARLLEVKRRRELKGLNHWDQFAPAYLRELAVRHEYLRRRAVEAFFRSERPRALARAAAKLGERCDAEDAVSDAYLRLLAGKTGPSHFYRILSQICIDRKRARASAAKLFSREHAPQFEGEATAFADPPCAILSQGDPLNILLRKEAIQDGIQDVKTKRKYRDTRELDWWHELLEHYCPEDVAGKRPAQSYI